MRLDRQLVVDALPNYEVGEELGRGGWAIVLHARHRILDREVAVKQLPVAFGADPIVRRRFIEEARLVAKLDHPHIAPVYDFVERDGVCLILMEYLAGGSLWDRFQTQGVRADEACAYILVVTSALEHAHEHGILHRDIKPENFLFDDRPGVIKLSDFGIAKVLGASAAHLTAAGQIIGTPAYMAPEQILGRPVTAATDVYACGTMLFELLTGELPFAAGEDATHQLTIKLEEHPRRLAARVPGMHPALDDVVMRSIAPDPEQRYATARAFGEALADAATRAMGVGWLEASGVQLLAASRLVTITERPTGPTASELDATQPRLATTLHDRIGPLIAAAREQIHAEDADLVPTASVRPAPSPSDSAPSVEPSEAAVPASAASAASPAPGAPGGPPEAHHRPSAAPAPQLDRQPDRQPDPRLEREREQEEEQAAGPDQAPAAAEGTAGADLSPGWFPDPLHRHDHRWWDGTRWTEHVADAGHAALDAPA